MPIDTSRLRLREYDLADWQAVHEYAADPLVVTYMWWGPNSEADTQRFIRGAMANRDADPRTDFEFAVTLRPEGRLIGGGSLNARNRPEYATAEIGYCFASEVWGHGYGTEATAALCEFGFREAGLRRIFALIDPENIASIRLVERLGFRREGHLREDTLIRGEWRDSLVFALLAKEWRQRAHA
jgi:RimJ/RimL family protein N-acetyltransferase